MRVSLSRIRFLLRPFASLFARIRSWNRPRRYWIRAAVALVVGLLLGASLNQRFILLPVRYQIYRGLNWLLPDRDPVWTAIVLIGDDEYWRGRLAGRAPIKRDYLANLLLKLGDCDPYAIALDFDLTSPAIGTMKADSSDYHCETQALITAIEKVAPHNPIVLPVTLSSDKSRINPSALDTIKNREDEVVRGTIALPFDYREIPTTERLGNGEPVRSLALRAAGLVNPRLLKRFANGRLFPFGSLVLDKDFRTFFYREETGFSRPVCKALRHKVVLVGAGWHSDPFGVGNDGLADSRRTPIGSVRAIYLHANYVEALLQSRVYQRLSETEGVVAEGIFSLAIGLMLASRMGHVAKFALTLLMSLALTLLTYIFAQNFGIFADFFFAVILLFAHASYSYWEDLESDAHLLSELPKEERERLEREYELSIEKPLEFQDFKGEGA